MRGDWLGAMVFGEGLGWGNGRFFERYFWEGFGFFLGGFGMGARNM